ncbi:MAG: 50S ribosomal protein L21 [Acidobacteriota bacterium]
MYAVVKTSGRQIRVAPGEKVRVNRIAGNAGDKVELADILLLHDGDQLQLGASIPQDARVTATIVGHGLGDKILVFKMKRRKHFRKRNGFRAQYTDLAIDEILVDKAGKKEKKKAEKEA